MRHCPFPQQLLWLVLGILRGHREISLDDSTLGLMAMFLLQLCFLKGPILASTVGQTSHFLLRGKQDLSWASGGSELEFHILVRMPLFVGIENHFSEFPNTCTHTHRMIDNLMESGTEHVVWLPRRCKRKSEKLLGLQQTPRPC